MCFKNHENNLKLFNEDELNIYLWYSEIDLFIHKGILGSQVEG